MKLILLERRLSDKQILSLRSVILKEIEELLENENVRLLIYHSAKPHAQALKLKPVTTPRKREELCERLLDGATLFAKSLRHLIKEFEENEAAKILFSAYEFSFAAYPNVRSEMKTKIREILSLQKSNCPDVVYELDKILSRIFTLHLDDYLSLIENKEPFFSIDATAKEYKGKGEARRLLTVVQKHLGDIRLNKSEFSKLASGDWTLSKVTDFFELLLDLFDVDESMWPDVKAGSYYANYYGVYVHEFDEETNTLKESYWRINIGSVNEIESKEEQIKVLVHEFMHFLQLYLNFERMSVKEFQTLVVAHPPDFRTAVDQVTKAILS